MQNPPYLQICPSFRFDRFAIRAAEKFYYTIVAPKSVRQNSDFTFNLTVHDATCEFIDETVVRISIEDEDDYSGFKVHRDITMKPSETEVITIPIGDISLERNYKLAVQSVSGIPIKHEASLELLTQIHAIFIQTDKALYKPKDSIKYRVLVLDDELKAASIDEKKMSICLIVSSI